MTGILTDEEFARFSRYGMEPFNWVVDRKILASVYPTGPEYLSFLEKTFGIRLGINLSETPLPDEWQRGTGFRSLHFPVTDMMAPGVDLVSAVIRSIDGHDGPVMVHCAAGIGRTGTVIGAYLVEHGMDPADAISFVRRKRKGSIQTHSQESLVMNWERKR